MNNTYNHNNNNNNNNNNEGINDMGGAPGNPAPRNHFLVRIVNPSGCHCTDAFGGTTYRRVPTPLRSTSPFPDRRWRGRVRRTVCQKLDTGMVPGTSRVRLLSCVWLRLDASEINKI